MESISGFLTVTRGEVWRHYLAASRLHQYRKPRIRLTHRNTSARQSGEMWSCDGWSGRTPFEAWARMAESLFQPWIVEASGRER